MVPPSASQRALARSSAILRSIQWIRLCTTMARMPYTMMANRMAKSSTDPLSAVAEGKMPRNGSIARSAGSGTPTR